MVHRDRWSRAVDLGVPALLAVLGLLEVWLPMESVAGEGSPWVSTVGILVVAALLTQRRVRPGVSLAALAVWPTLGVLAGGDLQVLFLGQLVPLLVLAYSVARHGQGRVRPLGMLAATAMLLLADLSIDSLGDPAEVVFHWGAMLLAVAVGLGLRASEGRATEAAVRAAQAAVRAAEAEAGVRERAMAAVVDERARIARELHDIVAHSVSVMVVQAGAAEQVVDDDPELARQALATIRATGSAALADMRRVVSVLREPGSAAPGLAPQPGLGSLPALVDAVGESGLRVELTVTGDPAGLPAALDLTAYRIVQEALTNVRRHSTADRAHVVLDVGQDDLEITVTDPGPARPAAHEPGHGLVGMHERVAVFGGRLHAAANGSGFSVCAVLPRDAR